MSEATIEETQAVVDPAITGACLQVVQEATQHYDAPPAHIAANPEDVQPQIRVDLKTNPDDIIGKQAVSNIGYHMIFGALARKFGHEGVIRIQEADFQGLIPQCCTVVQDGLDLVVTYKNEADMLAEQIAKHEADTLILKERLAEIKPETEPTPAE